MWWIIGVYENIKFYISYPHVIYANIYNYIYKLTFHTKVCGKCMGLVSIKS
jgi:hypothetical protein